MPSPAIETIDDIDPNADLPPELAGEAEDHASDLPATLKNDLGEIKQTVQQNAALQQLVSDPNIQAYLQARNAGKNVQLVAAEAPAPLEEPELPKDVDLDNLTNKELVAVLNDFHQKRTEYLLQKNIQPLAQSLNGAIIDQQKHNVTTQIAAVKAKYEDFDEYRQEMLALSQQHPNATVKQLYGLAKFEKNETSGTSRKERTDTATASERPTISSARPPQRVTSGASPRAYPPNGRAGMQQILQHALKDGITLSL